MITANPSRWMLAIVVLLVPAILMCIVPIVLVLLSFAGLVKSDLGLLFVALPAGTVAVLFARVGWSLLRDGLMTRPVLTIDDTGIFDRRIADALIPWSDVAAATSLRGAGRGGVVLELRTLLQTRLDSARPGTLFFEQPSAGIAHIPVERMSVRAALLEKTILDHAEAAGANVGTAMSHPRMVRRTNWV